MSRDELMDWFHSTAHKITLTLSNKGNKRVIAIGEDSKGYCYRSCGKDDTEALGVLKDMMSGTYYGNVS